MSEMQFLLRLFAALLFGAAIGAERQWFQRLAGLRTNALVSTGAALFVMASEVVITGSDVTRIAAQVVSGIGFLGAGIILRDGLTVRGLNTAATLWCSAAVGVLTGYGFILMALLGASAIVLANVVLRPIARKISGSTISVHGDEVVYHIEIMCKEDDEPHIRSLVLHAVGAAPFRLRSIHSEDLAINHNIKITAELESNGRCLPFLEKVVSHLSLERGVLAVAWRTDKEAAHVLL